VALGTARSPSPTSSGGSVDLKVAALTGGLEVLAVGTYKAALDAAGKGALGAAPRPRRVRHGGHGATPEAARRLEHGAHRSGSDGGDGTERHPRATVDAAFAKVTDVAGAAQLALVLEQTAAATYLSAQNVLTDKSHRAGRFDPDHRRQHAAILLYVLGEYPVPGVFAKTEMAVAA
jgi:hypothetical protein